MEHVYWLRERRPLRVYVVESVSHTKVTEYYFWTYTTPYFGEQTFEKTLINFGWTIGVGTLFNDSRKPVL